MNIYTTYLLEFDGRLSPLSHHSWILYLCQFQFLFCIYFVHLSIYYESICTFKYNYQYIYVTSFSNISYYINCGQLISNMFRMMASILDLRYPCSLPHLRTIFISLNWNYFLSFQTPRLAKLLHHKLSIKINTF